MRSIPAAAALCGLLMLSACASGESFEAEVAVEARWKCDVQRQAFAELGDIDLEFERRLASEGVTSDEYASFKEALDGSPELRSEVVAAYDRYCIVAED
jgi:hypothetical protein